MPPQVPTKKNSLQSVVDSIQKPPEANPFGQAPLPGYVPNPELKSLRTFQGDMQEHIEVKKETIATIALAEQKKKIERNEPTYTEPRTHSGRNSLFMAFGVLALIVGGVIVGGLYFFKTENETTVPTSVEKTLISYTQKKDITLPTADVSSLASALLQEQSSFPSSVNNVLYTSFIHDGSSVSAVELFRLIAAGAGDALKRNITDAMFGVYSYDSNEIFMIVRPEDFGIVYSGMLEWESTLGSNLSPFFPLLRQHLITNPSVFTDETYKNKDVRVIRNENGAVVLLYGFIDKNTLVITANERVFEAILNRYLQSQLSR